MKEILRGRVKKTVKETLSDCEEKKTAKETVKEK